MLCNEQAHLHGNNINNDEACLVFITLWQFCEYFLENLIVCPNSFEQIKILFRDIDMILLLSPGLESGGLWECLQWVIV